MAHLLSHGGTKELEQDFGALGQPPQEFLDAIEGGDEFELWEENEQPLSIFLKLQTQWRQGPAGATGLDYAGVESALRLLRFEPGEEFFEQLQTMERAALETLRKSRDK